jgi:hypothetical protein
MFVYDNLSHYILNQKERLMVKKMAIDSKNSVTRISAIDLLVLHGNEGIKDKQVKQHDLNTIK